LLADSAQFTVSGIKIFRIWSVFSHRITHYMDKIFTSFITFTSHQFANAAGKLDKY